MFRRFYIAFDPRTIERASMASVLVSATGCATLTVAPITDAQREKFPTLWDGPVAYASTYTIRSTQHIQRYLAQLLPQHARFLMSVECVDFVAL